MVLERNMPYEQTIESEEIDIIIRQAEASDVKAILGLAKHIGRETDYLTYGSEGLPYTRDEELSIILKYQQSDKDILLLIESDDQLIGMGNVTTIDPHRQNHVAEIGISIIEEYWGYGIGSMLLDALIEFAKQVGLRVLTLEVVTENQRAVRLYEKFGFKTVGKLTGRLKSNFTYYDTAIMELILV